MAQILNDLTSPGRPRLLQWHNASGYTCPPFGVFRVSDISESETDGNDLIIEGDLAFSTAIRLPVIQTFAVNMSGEVAAGDYGFCTMDFPTYAAYDYAGDGVASAGEVWGPYGADFLLHKRAEGFRILGNPVNGVVAVAPEVSPIIKLECKERLSRGDSAKAAYLTKWNGTIWARDTSDSGTTSVYGTTGWQGVCFGADETGLSGASSVSYIDAWQSPKSLRYYALGKGMSYFAGTATGDIAEGSTGTVTPDVLTSVSVTAKAKFAAVKSGDKVGVSWSDDATEWQIITIKDSPTAGCGISISDTHVISVKRADLIQANGGLATGSGTCDLKVLATCGITVGASGVGIDRSALIQASGGLATGSGTCDLKVLVDCGITVGSGGIKFDNATVAGNGLTTTGTCGLAVLADCGIIVTSSGVKFDAATVAGTGITAIGCTLNLAMVGGCGITVAGATISVNRSALVQANGGLATGSGTCDLKVLADCGIQVGAGGVGVDRAALVQASGGLEAGSGTCDLRIKASCGLELGTYGVRVKRADLIGTDNGLTTGAGTCDLKVKVGCGLQVDSTGVNVKASDIIGVGLVAVGTCGIEVDYGCGIKLGTGGSSNKIIFDAATVAGDGLDQVSTCGLKVKADCGISVSSSGVKVDRSALVGTGIVADSGTCNLKVSLTAGDGITVSGATITANIDTAAGLQFDGSSPKKIQINAGCGLEFSSGAVRVKRADLIQSGGGLATGSGTCDLKVDLSLSSPLWSGTLNSYVVVSDVSWNTGTCVMTKTTKTLTIPNNIPTTYT